MPRKASALSIHPGEMPLAKPFYRIGEIANWLQLELHVLRYWEEEFVLWLRVERSSKGQRIYNRRQAIILATIKELLYVELYTIEGAKRQLRLAAERERRTG